MTEGSAEGSTGTEAEAGTEGGAGTAAAAAAKEGPWTDTIGDADLRGWSVNKGYDKFDVATAAQTIAQQYRSLEKLVGAEKAGRTVEIPDWADSAQVDAFAARIGRPSPDKYDLGIPEGAQTDKGFETWARENFHKMGLAPAQAKGLAESYQAFTKAQMEAQQQAQIQQGMEAEKALKVKWGAAYDDKLAKASSAAKSLGISTEALDALQKAAGFDAVMEAFSSISEKIGEDKFIQGDTAATGAMTPEQAKEEMGRLRLNKEWMAAFLSREHPQHKAAVDRMTFLSNMMVAGKS